MEGTLTVREVCALYLRDAEGRGVKIDQARRAFRRAVQRFGVARVEELRALILYEYQQELRRKFKPGTVNGDMGYIRAALRHAWRLELIPRVPPFPRKLPENNARMGFLEPSDFRAICKALPGWARDPFAFAYASGWRRCEVIWLTWGEVDFKRRFIRLRADRSKNDESRGLPFKIGNVAAIIRRRRRERIEGLDYVFHLNGARISISRFWRAIARAREAAGRPRMLLHDCRRSAARDLVNAGVPENHAMKITGHKTREVFRRYNIVDERDLLKAARRCNLYRARPRKRS